MLKSLFPSKPKSPLALTGSGNQQASSLAEGSNLPVKLDAIGKLAKEFIRLVSRASSVQAQQHVMQELKGVLEKTSLHPTEFASGFIQLNEDPDQWLSFISEFEKADYGFPVFLRPQASAPLTIAPQMPSMAEVPSVEESETRMNRTGNTDILSDACKSPSSMLIVGASGSGKSTFVKQCLLYSLAHHPGAELQALDPQGSRYRGLEKTDKEQSWPRLEPDEDGIYPCLDIRPNTVTYAEYGSLEDMIKATEAIRYLYKIYNKRSKEKRSAARQGFEDPTFHLYRMFINEWNTFIDEAGAYKTQKKIDEFLAEAKTRGIKDPMLPLEAVQAVKTIFNSGRDLKVSACLVAQDFTKDSTGLSPAAQANAIMIGVGRLNLETRDGKYHGAYKLAKDTHRFPEKGISEELLNYVRKLEKENTPVLVSSQLSGSAGPFADVGPNGKKSIAGIYKHRIY